MTMLDYIQEQPRLFQNLLRTRQSIAIPFCEVFCKAVPDELYLIASGTSLNAAAAAAPFMEEVLGCRVTVTPPSRLGKCWGRKPMEIFISQGGQSTNIVAAIEQSACRLQLAITANPQGRVNSLCGNAMELPCGPETVGPKTKGYTVTILTLYLSALEAAFRAGRLSAGTYDDYMEGLQVMADQSEENIRRTLAWLEQNTPSLRGMRTVYLTGKRQSGIVAREGALKLMETLMIPAAAFDFEESLHGPSCVLGQGVAGFYLLPPPYDPDGERMCRVVEYHRTRCPAVYTAGLQESGDPRDCMVQGTGLWYTQPFEQILPFQAISAVIPQQLGIEGAGMRQFWELDAFLEIKHKASKTK